MSQYADFFTMSLCFLQQRIFKLPFYLKVYNLPLIKIFMAPAATT